MLDTELRMFTVIYDKAAWRASHPGKSGYDLYVEAFENLVSRVDLFLRRRYAQGFPSKTVTIVDRNSSSLCSALRRAQGDFQLFGTRWGNLYNVVETVMFLESHESPGLQLADLCSFAVWRLAEFDDDSLISMFASTFDREPLASTLNPGKWHGIKYVGSNPRVTAALQRCWP